MQKIYDIILSPAIVKAIKEVEEGKGVQLFDMKWESESIANRDKEETMFTFLSFSEGKAVTFSEPKIENEQKQEEQLNN